MKFKSLLEEKVPANGGFTLRVDFGEGEINVARADGTVMRGSSGMALGEILADYPTEAFEAMAKDFKKYMAIFVRLVAAETEKLTKSRVDAQEGRSGSFGAFPTDALGAAAIKNGAAAFLSEHFPGLDDIVERAIEASGADGIVGRVDRKSGSADGSRFSVAFDVGITQTNAASLDAIVSAMDDEFSNVGPLVTIKGMAYRADPSKTGILVKIGGSIK